ncbi:MAG: carbohydrate ABC transporter permease [Clostridia bacterium]|nr:carbohydrate ABC transporter permease [Clostridia bacterium]
MQLIKAFKHQFGKNSKNADKRMWRYMAVKVVGGIAVALILMGLSYIILYPLIYSVAQAIRTGADMYDTTIIYIPKHFTLENFSKAWTAMNFEAAFANTFHISFWPTIMQVCTCALAGYGLARFKFKGKGILFFLVVLTIIIPPSTIQISQYVSFRYFDPVWLASAAHAFEWIEEPYFDLTDSLWSFILPALFGAGLKSGLFVFVYRQFFSGFPKELEEAAYIDGCGAMKTFLRILVPNTTPAFITVFLFCITWYWNDYYTVPLFLPNADTLPSVLDGLYKSMQTTFTGEDVITLYPVLRAGILLYIAPLLTVFLLFQKKFTESIARSGIVG